MMRGPHAVAAGKHSSSCYRDYKWFYATGEPAAYTTAKHHAINSLERRIREKISEQWEMLMVLPLAVQSTAAFLVRSTFPSS